jgi:hypothetical protein
MADTKWTDLDENTTPATTDLACIVDDPGGSPANQKITLANLMKVNFSDAEGDPAQVSNTAAADGTSTFAARRDHAHLRSAFVGIRYSSNAGTAIGTGSATIVNFEDQEYDSGGGSPLVTTGASWKFTAPTDGYYHISFVMVFQGSAAWGASERVLATITVDTVDTVQLDRWEAQVTGTLVAKVNGSATIYLTAAQYISLTINQNSGSNLSPNAEAKGCWISIERVG